MGRRIFFIPHFFLLAVLTAGAARAEFPTIAQDTERFFADMKSADWKGQYDLLVSMWAERCLRAGAAGIGQLRTWLESGKDFDFTTGEWLENGGTAANGMRARIVLTLDRWPKDDALDVAQRLLASTHNSEEAEAAVTQLEKHEPGRHRKAIFAKIRLWMMDETNPALQERAQHLFIQLAGQAGDAELLAEAEKFSSGALSTELAEAELRLPAEAARTAFTRLMKHPEFREAVKMAAVTLPENISYADAPARDFAVQAIFPALDPAAQQDFLSKLAVPYFSPASSAEAAKGAWVKEWTGERLIAEAKGRLALLEALKKQVRAPETKRAWQDALGPLGRIAGGKWTEEDLPKAPPPLG